MSTRFSTKQVNESREYWNLTDKELNDYYEGAKTSLCFDDWLVQMTQEVQYCEMHDC